MDKEQLAIARLQDAARLSEHRYKKPLMVTYSGGKDSQVLVALAERAGINFEVVNSHTTADAPETVYFIREQFKTMEERGIQCSIAMPRYKDNPVSMWTLIPQKLMPPTRLVRYCCDVLKENTGKNRFIATGVRWAESARRKNSRGVMELMHKDPAKRIILMGDNDEKRRLFETCNLKGKMTVNPIVDWSDDDVWDYTHSEHLPINPLYCEGQKRVGCIGCPIAGRGGRQREFMRWPAYEKMYISAFERMLKARKKRNLEYTIDGKLYGVRWDDEPEHEGTTSEIKTRIVINGEELIALRNPDGSVGFIRSELLKPVEGELNKEFAQICVRPANQECRFIYAVKDGMILRALIAPMNIKDDVADDPDEIIAELMSRRQKQIIEKMHDDLQDLAAQEAAEKAKQIKNREEK